MDAVAIPGGRDVRAVVDGSAGADHEADDRDTDDRDTDDRDADVDDGSDDGPDAVVVACPPHPRHGGSRSDARLRAVGDALAERGVACLRFDYGPWDEGRGEVRDAGNAVDWARERFDAVALFGYSFGAGVALRAAAARDPPPAAAGALAPDADDADAVAALDCPVQVVYGERDDAVDWEPAVERARDRDGAVVGFPTGHQFVGYADAAAADVAAFLGDRL